MIKRPHLVHFLSVITEDHLHIRSSITFKEYPMDQVLSTPALDIVKGIEKELTKPRFPIQAYYLLGSHEFNIKVVAFSKTRKILYNKTFESDSYGNLNLKIPLTNERKDISSIQVYETKTFNGIDLLLGTYIPLSITSPKKLIICDFDKTLVDTRYSTTKDVYNSLTQPVEYFPIIEKSVELIKKYIDEGYHPFILSASPHFYEDAMRDWLYHQQIYTAGIFLKDYRKVFSFLEGDLTPKDLKIQGLYKFNHLLDILLITGIPQDLVLMGDNFESDPIIYLTLANLLIEQTDPWKLWNQIKRIDIFQMNRKQESQFLSKLYQLATLAKSHGPENLNLKIFIRKKSDEHSLEAPHFLADQMKHIELYHAPNFIHTKAALIQNKN